MGKGGFYLRLPKCPRRSSELHICDGRTGVSRWSSSVPVDSTGPAWMSSTNWKPASAVKAASAAGATGETAVVECRLATGSVGKAASTDLRRTTKKDADGS